MATFPKGIQETKKAINTKEFSSGFQDFDFKNYLGCSFMLIIGVVIFLLNEKLVVISENNESVKL
jgi:hypothetical protein